MRCFWLGIGLLLLCLAQACQTQPGAAVAHGPSCAQLADQVGPAPWLLTDDQVAAATQLAESLTKWTKSPSVDARELQSWLGRVRRDDPRMDGLVVGRAVRTAASSGPYGGANVPLARLLALEMQT